MHRVESPAMDSTERTAIVATFLLAEAGIRIFTTKKKGGRIKIPPPRKHALNLLYQPEVSSGLP